MARREADDLAAAMVTALAGRWVLEGARSTGVWTARAAEAAAHITATDAAPEMLALARTKGLPTDQVEFRLADASALDVVVGRIDAALALFLFGDGTAPDRRFLHLKGVAILGNTPTPLRLPFWRVRIGDVLGWWLGSPKASTG